MNTKVHKKNWIQNRKIKVYINQLGQEKEEQSLGIRCIKYENNRAFIKENKIKESWKNYFRKLSMQTQLEYRVR